MAELSRWQQEFNALPEWAQELVRGLQGCAGYGTREDDDPDTDSRNYEMHFALVKRSAGGVFFSGLCGAIDLAKALSAPWPPPPAPDRERRAFNLVEMIAGDEDDCAFDQPCAFGHRVNGHAVYCHNDGWPDSPRKCHRNRDDYRHEDCPGFVANPDAA